MKSLYDKLVSYSESDYYGFHMPGDKRNRNITQADLPYHLDITEIDGFDDLHHATGVLLQAQERTAKLYKAEETHFLINGSTCGILSAILGCTKKGKRILVARNCHKSVYHAIFLNELDPVYVYPEYEQELELNGEVKADEIGRLLEADPEICAVMITSPTYDGVVSDVKAIADVVHKYQIPLIVDEAHGAHFGFHPYFPDNANTKGADIVIHSLHKTLPALTQTALLHINGSIVDRKNVRRYLDMFQTSSPSYVLMSSIDVCIEMLVTRGEEVFREYTEMLDKVRRELSTLKYLKILETEHYDRSKIVISVKNTNYSSRKLYQELLEVYHLQMEMAAGSYILAMTTIGDTQEGMDRLVNALKTIDMQLQEKPGIHLISADRQHLLPKRNPHSEQPKQHSQPRQNPAEVVYNSAVMSKMISEAVVSGEKGAHVKRLPFGKCAGYISTEYAYIYPPGIPILVPGERISKEETALLQNYHKLGFRIEGLEDERTIEVWKNE